MGFVDAIKSCFGKYATFSGRASRSEFWFFNLFLFLVIGILGILSAIFFSVSGGLGITFGVLLLLFYLGVILPSLAVQIRRLHDINKSGWWWLVNLIPSIGGVIFLVFVCLKGTVGANNFGADPLEQKQTEQI